MKNKILGYILLAIIAAAIIGGAYFWQKQRTAKNGVRCPLWETCRATP